MLDVSDPLPFFVQSPLFLHQLSSHLASQLSHKPLKLFFFFLFLCLSFINCSLSSIFLFFVPRTRSFSHLLLFATIVHHYLSTVGNHTMLLPPPPHYKIAMMKAFASFSSPPFPSDGPCHHWPSLVDCLCRNIGIHLVLFHNTILGLTEINLNGFIGSDRLMTTSLISGMTLMTMALVST